MQRILVKPVRIRFPWMLVALSILATFIGVGLILSILDITHLEFNNHAKELVFFVSLPFAILALPVVAWSLIKGWLVECRIVGLLYARSDGMNATIASFVRSRFRPQIVVPNGTTVYVEVTPKTPKKGSDRKRDFTTKWEIFAGRHRIRFATYFEPDTEMIDALCREFSALQLVPKSRIL